MSETAFSNKDAAVIDEGWVEEVFCTTVKTEERVAMMEALIERGVGLAEVEHFFEGLADSCRTFKNKCSDNAFLMKCPIDDEKIKNSLNVFRMSFYSKLTLVSKWR